MDQGEVRFAPLRALKKAPIHLALALGIMSAVVATPVVAAQTPTDGTTTEELTRTITVAGVGTVSVEPDTADVNFAVQADSESLNEAQDDASTRMQAITDELVAGGVAEEDIVTSSYYVTVMNEYDENGNFVAISGYRVDAQITATIRDLDALGGLLDSVVNAGANGIYGMYFYVNDPAPAASQARQAAIEDARAKADELAEATGVTVIGVVSINETWAPQPMAKDYYAGGMGGADMAAAESMPVPVSPGTTDITVEVQVVYEINQPNG